ncbi:MAG: MGMT family protein [Calditrichia bacterium]
MNISEKHRLIFNVVKQIPKGRVATYGQVARVAGLEGHARLVGYALHSSPSELDLPWQRVINSKGQISLSKEDGRYFLQKSLLEAEGIVFKSEKVSLREYGWKV